MRVLVILELLLVLGVALLAAGGPWPIGHGLTWRTSGGWVGVAHSRPDPAWATFQAQLPYGAVVSYQLAPPLKKVNAWVVRWRRWRAVGTLSDEYEVRVWFLLPLLLVHPAVLAVRHGAQAARRLLSGVWL